MLTFTPSRLSRGLGLSFVTAAAVGVCGAVWLLRPVELQAAAEEPSATIEDEAATEAMSAEDAVREALAAAKEAMQEAHAAVRDALKEARAEAKVAAYQALREAQAEMREAMQEAKLEAKAAIGGDRGCSNGRTRSGSPLPATWPWKPGTWSWTSMVTAKSRQPGARL